MAKRVVDDKFWTDEKVEQYTPEEKYFWLFLLTNPFTKQCGIYHITKKQMSFYLGYDVETCTKLLDRFENQYGVVKYIDNELAIKNYLKHSIVKGGKPIEEQIKRELGYVKSAYLVKWVLDNIENDIDSVVPTVQSIVKEKEKYIKEKEINNNAYAYACTEQCTHVRTQERTQKKKFVPPTLEEVEAYCKQRNNGVNAKSFIDYYAANEWRDKNNDPVVSWKQKMISVWEKPKDETQQEDTLPTYDPSLNKDMNEKDKQELLKLMGKEL